MHPQLTYTVYIVAALIFVGMLTWMFVYNKRMKDARRTQNTKGRAPIVAEEDIVIATREKEHRQVPKP